MIYRRRYERRSAPLLDVPPTNPLSVDPTTHSAAGLTEAYGVGATSKALEEDVPLPVLERGEQPRCERGIAAGAAADEVPHVISATEGTRDDVIYFPGGSATVDAFGVALKNDLNIATPGDTPVYRPGLLDVAPSPDIAALEAAAESLTRLGDLANAIALWAIILRMRGEITDAT